MKSNSELLDELKEFTLSEAGRDPSNITEDICLERDLGIYGDDASGYLVAFAKAFNVDVSKFMAADYFSGEGISFGNLFKKTNHERKELSIGHLIKAIKTGRLDAEVINSKT